MFKHGVKANREVDFTQIGLSDKDVAKQQLLAGQVLVEDIQKETREINEDPIDGKFMSAELLDRVDALDLESIEDEDLDKLIEGLKAKEMPEGDEELQKRAEEVAREVLEVKAVRTRRRRAGKGSMKVSRTCPEGYKQDAKGKCVRQKRSKLLKVARMKKKWRRSGAGTKSLKKSARLSKRFGESENNFANELAGLLSESFDENASVRDEIFVRAGDILEMLEDEFNDEGVSKVFLEAYEPIMEAWDTGALSESNMEDDEFVSTLRPVLTMITKSLSKLDGAGVDPVESLRNL